MKPSTLLDQPKSVYQSVNMLTMPKKESSADEKYGVHVNLMGRGLTLADLVEWRIGADKKRRKIKVSRIVERLGDYSSEFHDTND